MARPRSIRPPAFARIVALLAIALVLALSVFSASPDLHGWLHGHGLGPVAGVHKDGGPANHAQDTDDEGGCVVTLFAQGLVLALAAIVLAPAGRLHRPAQRLAYDRIVPESPRYLLLPTQAPPVGLG